jgi:drug/metabolite transporter (DMT)-like permease
MLARLPKSTRILFAFACVYIFWGSTYGAIHIAGEHLPVPVVSGTRSLCSATLIILICLLRGKSLRVPAGEPWKLVLIGLLFMSANNMLLTWGEKMVPSGFASLIISTIPIMVALLEMALPLFGVPGGEPLNLRGWAGTLLATLGIFVLVWPALHGSEPVPGYSRPLLGVVVLLGAALSFAVGSVLSRRFRFQADTFVATGWQIGSAGIFNIGLAAVTGALHRAEWSWRGFGAVLYLSIFGSTYAFVNPVIAVLLGFLLLHERLVPAELAGMAVIVCGVAMVVYGRAVARKGPGDVFVSGTRAEARD